MTQRKTRKVPVETGICCLCGGSFANYGNNPWPLGKKPDDRCCNHCNGVKVIPARIRQITERSQALSDQP